jgi:enoyl-CoA hydratase/carnithine racemase
VSGDPAVVVELDHDRGPPDASPCVVVGVGYPGDLTHGVDVALTSAPDPPAPWVAAPAGDLDGAVREITAAAATSPDAAVVLAQLLRMGDTLDVAGALAAESLAYALLQTGASYRGWLGAHRRTREATHAGAPAVLVERDGGCLTITLNRPRVHNAFDVHMRDGLVEALELAALDASISTVELRGAGPTFCAGGDLDEFGTVPDPITGHLVRMTRSPARSLWRVAARVSARIHGACVGAGIELPAVARRVVAAPDATFRLPEVGMGLVPGAGGTVSIPRRIGRHRMAWMAITGEVVDAETALAWGLVDEVSAHA